MNKKFKLCPHGCGYLVKNQIALEHINDIDGKRGDNCLLQWANKNVPKKKDISGKRGYYGQRRNKNKKSLLSNIKGGISHLR